MFDRDELQERLQGRTASIRVCGAKSELAGVPGYVLEGILAIPDPQRWFNRAFREKRWDGMVRLYEGNRFPAGLTGRVVEFLTELGCAVSVVETHEKEEIDVSRFTKHYLPGIELWDHQFSAVLALLTHPRGVVRSPTGSGKTEIIAATAQYLYEERGYRSLIVVPKKGLLSQTVSRLERYYNGDIEVGMYGDSERRPGKIVVGTAQTLIRCAPQQVKGKIIPPDPEIREMVKTFEVILLDEVHHASSTSWATIAMKSAAVRRYGLSGTPLKHDEVSDLRMVGATGPVIFECEANRLIDEGLAAKPKIAMVMVDAVFGPPMEDEWQEKKDWKGNVSQVLAPAPYAKAYDVGIAENDNYHDCVIRCVSWLVDRDKRTLILCRRKSHWLCLKERLEQAGHNFVALWGETEVEVREEAKKSFDSKRTKAILATVIFDEGEDLKGVEALVLAEGVKISTNVLQRIGRGMRKKEKGPNEVWVVDFVPTVHPKLIEHAMKRARIYEGEGYEVKLVTTWPEDDTDLLPFEKWEEYPAGGEEEEE
jgi:superfamily II DNA or RNA helicase